jgi:hypothetical protein
LRFEHILQVYWSKGFFFGGKLIYTNKLNFNTLFKSNLYGLSLKFKKILTMRLELTTFTLYYTNLFYIINYSNTFSKKIQKTINIILSQVNNVNSTVREVQKLFILKKYLNRSYQGYCHSIGKPVRGQRTWSNAWNSFKVNTNLRSFIAKTRQLALLKDSNLSQKIDYRVIKKKYISNKVSNVNTKNNLNSLNLNLFPTTSCF